MQKGAIYMTNLSPVRRMVMAALCVALCVVLPIAFHTIPDAGSIFLPMHIPVLLCGLICGWPYGLVCGLLGPLMSSVLTGMPPAAYLPPMMVECATYGAATGLLLKFVRTRSLTADLYISLIGAMLLGRIVSGVAKALIFSPGMAMGMWITSSYMPTFPGKLFYLSELAGPLVPDVN